MDSPHRCDEKCKCPVDGKPLFYARSTGEHACMDVDCVNGHGMVSSLPVSGFAAKSIRLEYAMDDIDTMIADKIQTAVQADFSTDFSPAPGFDDLVETMGAMSLIQEAVRKAQEIDMKRVEEAYARALELNQGIFIVTKQGRVIYAEASEIVPALQAYWANADHWNKAYENAHFMGGFTANMD